MATQNSLLAPENGEFNYCIQGTNVTFPCKAYPSQLAVMNRILKGLARRQNCLIESPTGSGKSLALLCSCLAWQRAIIEQNRIKEEAMQYQVNNIFAENTNSEYDEGANPYNPEDKKFTMQNKMKEEDMQYQDSSEFARNVTSQYFEEFSPRSPGNKINTKYKKKMKGVHYIEQTNPFTPRKWNDRVQELPKFENKFDDDDDDFQVPKKLHTSKKVIPCTKDMIPKIKTPTNVDKFLVGVPTTKVNHIVNRSPVKVSLSQCSPKTTSSDFPHSASSSTIKNISPFKVVMGFSNGSICECSAVSIETIPLTTSISTSMFNSIPVNNNSYTDINSLVNIASPMSASNLQDFEKTRVPQIYFGTRTHKQITQIVRELKKTVYRNVRMCILSSRERTCIHKTVSKSRNINNDCMELLDPHQGAGCQYFNYSHNVGFEELRRKGLSDCWDLEDLVKVGRKLKVCPYYTIRNLMCAEIIFCPYNYLIDPRIREKMNIKVQDNVIILDEAHNIEDSAREAASFTVTEQELQEALVDIEKMSYLGYKTYSHDVVSTVLNGLCNWINKNVDQLTDYIDFNKSGKVWSGEELIAMLSEIKAGPEDFKYIQKHFNNVTFDERNENPKEPKKPALSALTVSLIEDLLRIFGFLYTEKLEYMQDYKAVITKEISNKPTPSKTGFVSKHSKGFTYHLNFWCLNPGVAFSSIKNQIHSLIVASGTLSPMKTFESELSMQFPLALEANHVINAHQVWIGSVGCGPSGTCLKAVYQQIDTFAFQDDLGELVLQVCQIVPDGVLCFFPSYGALEKLTSRWQITGLWERLENYKIILSEPRKNGEKSFEEIMNDYYDIIADEQLNGALFFAVYRGKVSEGLDFADNNARAVISIGIPYPSFKDMQVDLKRKYNDKFCHKKKLMTGSDWYETRAFRALNQALGRCIRHRNDWGALILVDDRFKERRNTTGLSKWIRNYIMHYDKFHPAINSLNDFIQNQQFMESQTSQLLSESIITEPSSPSLFE